MPSPTNPEIKDAIREKALGLGFSAVGFAPADLGAGPGEGLRRFLGEGRHATMDWLAGRVSERASPKGLWADAHSVVVVGLNYGPHENPLTSRHEHNTGAISVYAQGRDYHDVMKKRLKQLGRWMGKTFSCELKVFVDTAPVMEKPLAQAAGLGWQGKHTNLVSRDFGSWLFLGEVFTTLALEPDTPTLDHCGECTACLEACPTGALTAPYEMDARKCISYLTIEHGGDIQPELAAKMGDHIYGCDDCLAVCPWNKFAIANTEPQFAPRPETVRPALDDLLTLDDETFRKRFSGSPVKRSGVERIQRNARIALMNFKNGLKP